MSGPGAVLDVRCLVSTDFGWLNLNDHINYELEASTAGARSVSHTRHEIKSPFAAGAWVVDAHANVVEETVSVWVSATSIAELHRALNKLCDAVTQLHYVIDWQFEDSGYRWQCQISDYQVVTKRELLYVNRAQVIVKARRAPAVDWFSEEDLW